MKKDTNKNKDKKVSIKTCGNAIFAEMSTMQTIKKRQNIGIIWLIISGLLIGFVNGFWGGGGGMICVPILINLLKLPEKKGHATTILIMLPLCITSFIVYLIKGSIDIGLAINVGVGFVLGGILGAILLKKINNIVLQLIFAVIIIVGGIKLII